MEKVFTSISVIFDARFVLLRGKIEQKYQKPKFKSKKETRFMGFHWNEKRKNKWHRTSNIELRKITLCKHINFQKNKFPLAKVVFNFSNGSNELNGKHLRKNGTFTVHHSHRWIIIITVFYAFLWMEWDGILYGMCVCVMDWNGDMHFNTLCCRF